MDEEPRAWDLPRSHTAGPWSASPDGAVWADRPYRHLIGVASIGWASHLEEQAGNARLMAAAPEMLDALEQALMVYNPYDYPQVYGAMVQAVRKAKGVTTDGATT